MGSLTTITKEEKEVPAVMIKVWSYKTYRDEWEFDLPARDTIKPESKNN